MSSAELQKIIYYVVQPELQEQLFWVKIVFIFFSFLFLAGIVYFLAISSYFEVRFLRNIVEFLMWKPYGFINVMRNWKKIQDRIVTGSESEYKIAIIEADDFLNSILEKRGYGGKSFEEKIKNAEEAELSNLQDVLEAHKIRNSIVYDPDYRLDLDKAKKILKVYEQVIMNIETG